MKEALEKLLLKLLKNNVYTCPFMFSCHWSPHQGHPSFKNTLHNVYCVSEKRGSTVFIHGTYLLDFFGVPSGLGNCDPADNENKCGLHTAFSSRVGWLHDHTVGKLTSDAGTHCQQSGRLQVIIQPVQRHQVFVLDVQLLLFWHEFLKKKWYWICGNGIHVLLLFIMCRWIKIQFKNK